MKRFFQGVLLMISAFLIQLTGPWYMFCIPSFFIGIWIKKGIHAWLIGFLANALVWMLYGFYLNNSSNAILSDKIAGNLLPLSFMNIVLVSGLISGLIGGFACLSGALAAQNTKKKQSKYHL